MLQDSMIWLGSAPAGTQVYAVFRKEFSLVAPLKTALLRLFADSRYILWINGQYVERGPCRFDPRWPQYDTVDASAHLKKGLNAVAVLVHHYHDGREPGDPIEWFNGRMMRHHPGLTLHLELTDAEGRSRVVRTDPSWRGSTRTRFKPSPVSWSTISDDIDARLDAGDWTLPGFDDSEWEPAAAVDGSLWGPLQPRAIPMLRETEIVPARILRIQNVVNHELTRPGGAFMGQRPIMIVPETSPEQAARALASCLPLTLASGQEVLIDVGRVVLAYDRIDIEADEGSMIEVVHGVGYWDGSLQEVYGINRFTTRAGRQTCISTDTCGCSHLVLRVLGGRIRIQGIALVNRLYPFDRVGRFSSNDDMLNEVWERSVFTQEVTCDDANGCDFRERAEWSGDPLTIGYQVTRVTLSGRKDDGTPFHADSRLFAANLRHLAQSQLADGRIKAHHPSDRMDCAGYIEDFACIWVMNLRRYYENTNDIGLVRELWPAIPRQMQWFFDRRTETGLVKAREFAYFCNPLVWQVCEGATLNAYIYGALLDSAFLARAVGERQVAADYERRASALSSAFNRVFWDPAAGTYHGALLDGVKADPTAHAALLALHQGVVPDARKASVLRYLIENERHLGSPFMIFFLLEVLAREDDAQHNRMALDLIRRRWTAPPLIRNRQAAYYAIETIEGTWPARTDMVTVSEYYQHGEICHSIGAVPAWYLGAWVLGVRLDGPVAGRRLLIEPRLVDLTEAQGVVGTELGPVPVSWKTDPDGQGLEFRVEIPEGAAARLGLPAEFTPETGDGGLVLDGKTVPYAIGPTGRAVFAVRPGRHSGRIQGVHSPVPKGAAGRPAPL